LGGRAGKVRFRCRRRLSLNFVDGRRAHQNPGLYRDKTIVHDPLLERLAQAADKQHAATIE
ncbi:MAG: hypothetical protein WBQ24_22510, partial [Xanthobacteraceae bacterium]